MMVKLPFLRLWLLLALLLSAGCAVNPVSGQADFVLLTEDQEIAMGRQENPKVLKEYGRYDDAKLQAYVTEIGDRLAANSQRNNLVYHFTVLDSTEVNAFALPGGYVYITRGLLAYLNSEAEVAAVLGHEIGHVNARHGVRQYSAAAAANLGIGLGSIFVPELRNQGAQDLLNTLNTALLRGYGRDHELEADRLGAEYLARTGYDPQAMIQVIKILKNQEEFEVALAKEENREPHIYHGVFATHPDNDQRLHEVVGEANRLQGMAVTRDSAHDQYLGEIDGLNFGPSAHEGVLRGRDFYHRDLGIALQFPAEWRVDNQPDRLLALAPQQAAILQITVEDRGKKTTAAEFLRQHFRTDQLGHSQALEVHGAPAYGAIIPLNTSLGRRDARVVALLRERQVYLFIGVAKAEAAEAQYDDAFLETVRSLHPLTDAERSLAEPLELHVVKAGADTRFEALAAHSRLPNHAEQQLRLLNDYYPEGEPKAGEAIKVVR